MNPQIEKLFAACPFHADSELVPTNTKLPEGVIFECANCGLGISSCSQQQFLNALNGHWSESINLDLPSSSLRRVTRRRSRELNIAKPLLNSNSKLNLLDIGCRTGTIVAIFESLGVEARGVDPALRPIAKGRAIGRNLDTGYLESYTFF